MDLFDKLYETCMHVHTAKKGVRKLTCLSLPEFQFLSTAFRSFG